MLDEITVRYCFLSLTKKISEIILHVFGTKTLKDTNNILILIRFSLRLINFKKINNSFFEKKLKVSICKNRFLFDFPVFALETQNSAVITWRSIFFGHGNLLRSFDESTNLRFNQLSWDLLLGSEGFCLWRGCVEEQLSGIFALQAKSITVLAPAFYK